MAAPSAAPSGPGKAAGGEFPERATLALIDPLSHPYATMMRAWPALISDSVERPRSTLARAVAKLMGIGEHRPSEVRFRAPIGTRKVPDANGIRFFLQAAAGLHTLRRAELLGELQGLLDLFDATSYAESCPRFKEMLLFALVRNFRPERLLETGVAHGISSAYILSALRANGSGHLDSIDLPTYDPKGFVDSSGHLDPIHIPKDKQPGWRIPDPLRDRWTLHLGDARNFLQAWDAGPVDLFFHDSDHGYPNMKWEFDWAWSHLRPGGWLVSDDIRRNAAWDEFLRAHPEGKLLNSTRVGALQRPG